MDRHREHLFCVILANRIVVEDVAYLLWRRDAVARLHQRGFVLLANDVHAQFDTLVADKYGRTGDELAHLVLALAAERAVERVLRFAAANLAHSISPPAGRPARDPAALPPSITGALLRVRSTNVTRLRGFSSKPCQITLANHGSADIIKVLLINQNPVPCRLLGLFEGGHPPPRSVQSRSLLYILRSLFDDLVDLHPPHPHLAGQEIITLERVLDFLQRLTGMLAVDFVKSLLQVHDLLGVHHDIGRLPL